MNSEPPSRKINPYQPVLQAISQNGRIVGLESHAALPDGKHDLFLAAPPAAYAGTGESAAEHAAIAFALETDQGLDFLRCWNEGDYAAIRRDWPEAPAAVFLSDPVIAALSCKNEAVSVRDALVRLSEAVFGRELGDEPDVYADHDKLCELARITRTALASTSKGFGGRADTAGFLAVGQAVALINLEPAKSARVAHAHTLLQDFLTSASVQRPQQ
ncbi:hypothetical protein [Pseudoxanthomonas kaohsiungensis]|uniref:Uncharacterized protein n=1 Tax=Pseudoxanthomonas kaohsiungensis TaxID=283923 RepID=A0ABW3LZY4_9GAMM|nr:hypothetical protein [Pseudoxanthomonas kaohsiungensis]KAF1702871.1 hypothetical protein CSC66_08850 [Pseudoxanthomonas kaohsiungensis]